MSVTLTDVTRTDDGYLVGDELVTLPVEVRSAWMIGAQFLVDAAAAEGVIDYSGLRIARQPANRAVCSITAVQYLDNDLGPYNEIAVAFVVEPHDAPPGAKTDLRAPTTFIHRLPVNQPFTSAAGKGIWGFPKWIADIELVERARSTTAIFHDGDEFVLSLHVRSSPLPLPAQEMEMTCYSWCDGVLRRTPWTTRTSRSTVLPGGGILELGSRHELARELREIGLPKRPFMSMTTRMMTATFGDAEIVSC